MAQFSVSFAIAFPTRRLRHRSRFISGHVSPECTDTILIVQFATSCRRSRQKPTPRVRVSDSPTLFLHRSDLATAQREIFEHVHMIRRHLSALFGWPGSTMFCGIGSLPD